MIWAVNRRNRTWYNALPPNTRKGVFNEIRRKGMTSFMDFVFASSSHVNLKGPWVHSLTQLDVFFANIIMIKGWLL